MINAVVLQDMQRNVFEKMMRDEGGVLAELERRDFREQFDYAEDDKERARLCRRWSNAYEPPTRKARTR